MRKINRMVYVMEYIEVTGKDVNEAVINAAQKLETPSDELEYEVMCMTYERKSLNLIQDLYLMIFHIMSKRHLLNWEFARILSPI